MAWRFHPPLSWSTTNVWVPAGRVTVAVTVVQFCQPAGGGDIDIARQVGAREVGDVQGVGYAARRGHAQAHRVGAGAGRVDRVPGPLPAARPAKVVAGAGAGRIGGVAGRLQVNPVAAVAVGRAVDRADVVAHALPAGVVVGGLHGAGHLGRGAAEGGLARRGLAVAGRDDVRLHRALGGLGRETGNVGGFEELPVAQARVVARRCPARWSSGSSSGHSRRWATRPNRSGSVRLTGRCRTAGSCWSRRCSPPRRRGTCRSRSGRPGDCSRCC